MHPRHQPVRSATRLAIAGLLLAASASVAGAQAPTPPRNAFTLAAGGSTFDLSGTGNTAFVAGRLDRLLVGRFVIGELSLGWFRPEEQFGGRRHYLIGEAQLQAQAPFGPLAPYVGVGAGQFRSLGSDRPGWTDPTVSGAGGVRFALPDARWGARAELRVRGIGSGFTASTAEWTLGLSRRF